MKSTESPDPTDGRKVEDFYSQVETGYEVNARLQIFLEEYRGFRASRARPISVLDVGCGKRAVLSEGIHAEDAYTGCDIAPPDPDVSVRFKRVDLNNESLAEKLPNEKFEVIFCGEVIEHVFSPDALIKDLMAVMADDGLLILSTPNLAYWLNRLLLIFGISPLFVENSAHVKLGRRFGFLGQGNETQGHIRLFTHRAMLDFLQLYGVRLERVRSFPVWNFPPDRWIARISPSLAPGNIYLIRK